LPDNWAWRNKILISPAAISGSTQGMPLYTSPSFRQGLPESTTARCRR